MSIKEIKDWYWKKRRVILQCEMCGQMLAPFIINDGPYGCGWVRLAGGKGRYICHQCYGHHMQFNNESREKYFELVEEKNQNLLRKIEEFKKEHPNVRIKTL